MEFRRGGKIKTRERKLLWKSAARERMKNLSETRLSE